MGVGQIYGCDNPWTGGIFLCALLLSSPLLCLHAAMGSLLGIAAGEQKPSSSALPASPSAVFHIPDFLKGSASKGPMGVASPTPGLLPERPAFGPQL